MPEGLTEVQNEDAELASHCAEVGHFGTTVATSELFCGAQPCSVDVVKPHFHDQEDLFSFAKDEVLLGLFLCRNGVAPGLMLQSLLTTQGTER